MGGSSVIAVSVGGALYVLIAIRSGIVGMADLRMVFAPQTNLAPAVAIRSGP
jgi:hypothetical protein